MEKEWFQMTSNDTQGSRFYQLKCRIAFATSIKASFISLTFLILFSMYINLNN